MIHIDAAPLIDILDKRGWTQGNYAEEGDGPVSLHGAVRLCSPEPGDASIIEAVANRQGWGMPWNDDASTKEPAVRARLVQGIDITDEDLGATFGPQWRSVVVLVRRIARLDPDEARALEAERSAIEGEARDSARESALEAERSSAGDAAWSAAWDSALDATEFAVLDAVRDAALAIVTYDLATENGFYTFTQRDLLLAAWRTVIGVPDELDDPTEQ